MVTLEVVAAVVEAPAVCCPTMGGRLSGLLLSAQRLFAVFWMAMGLTVVGICVAGSSLGTASPAPDVLPGDAVMSREPHMGHTMSEHETLEG